MAQRCRALLGLLLCACLLPASSLQSVDCVGLPNLVIDAISILSSISVTTASFNATGCAVVEGSVNAPGLRKLLNFESAIANLGAADLVLGNPTTALDLFTYAPCHNHYHFQGYALYQIFKYNPLTWTVSSPVATGHKQGFCVEDVKRVNPYQANPTPYDCAFQGLTAGFADVYTKGTSGQWVDVTDLPRGRYWLRVVINPFNTQAHHNPLYAPQSAAAKKLQECSYADNTASVPFWIV